EEDDSGASAADPPATTPTGASPRRTPEEQRLIDEVAQTEGREWADAHAALILNQARAIGNLPDDIDVYIEEMFSPEELTNHNLTPEEDDSGFSAADTPATPPTGTWPNRTPEESAVLDDVVRYRGGDRAWAEAHQELILNQARAIGNLP